MIKWEPLISPPAIETAQKLRERAQDARKTGKVIYPSDNNIFRSLRLCAPQTAKCVIVGQDPYHEENQAMGLSFSVNSGCPLPPSLVNIFQELCADIQCEMPKSGDLTPWAKQGVLLLNTVLTVEQHNANSHVNWGWQTFTKAVIEACNNLPQPIVFILWGSQAQKFCSDIDWTDNKCVLKSPHPSPLSAYRGFFGSKPFSKANKWLYENGSETIDWRLS